MLGAIYVSKNLIQVQKELELQALIQKEENVNMQFQQDQKIFAYFLGESETV